MTRRDRIRNAEQTEQVNKTDKHHSLVNPQDGDGRNASGNRFRQSRLSSAVEDDMCYVLSIESLDHCCAQSCHLLLDTAGAVLVARVDFDVGDHT